MENYSFYEFFSGGGMVREGLGASWNCLFANDIDKKKGRAYVQNWGGDEFLLRDINKVEAKDILPKANLAWASFPCQDLSLAGLGNGLKGERSGTFWAFWRLMIELSKQKRAPEIIVLENVYGALTSHEGNDFLEISRAFADLGFRFGAVVIDSVHFIPQSRPRLFIVGVKDEIKVPNVLKSSEPSSLWHPKVMLRNVSQLPKQVLPNWIWWNIPKPQKRKLDLVDILESNPSDVEWHSAEYTDSLLESMTPVNLKKVEAAQLSGKKMAGTIYRRTRKGKVRAEVRFDGTAGCLRTPSGGSSRQFILLVEKDSVRSRLISARETARLMGLPDSYVLPERYNDAYHLTGDGVVVPVIRYLSRNLFEPILDFNFSGKSVDSNAYVKGTQGALL